MMKGHPQAHRLPDDAFLTTDRDWAATWDVDVKFSIATVQHNPPELVEELLSLMLTTTRPGMTVGIQYVHNGEETGYDNPAPFTFRYSDAEILSILDNVDGSPVLRNVVEDEVLPVWRWIHLEY